MSLVHSTIRGVIWNFTEMLLRRGVAAATTLFLAYFVVPADFGLMSMAALFLAVAMGFMDSGLREALVRRKHLSSRLLNAALLASLMLGFSAYILLFIASPWIADFYSEPRLTNLVRIGGLQIIIGAFQIVPTAQLQQKLDFKSLMKASFPAALASSLLALLLAWIGLGVWALIAQSLLAAAMTTIGVWRFTKPQLGWSLNLRLLAPLYRFGYQLFLSGIIALTVRNAVPSFLGKFLGATFAGYYFFVDKILEMVMGQLVYSVQNVTYPAFSKIGQEKNFLRDGYRKVVQVMIFSVSPILCIGAGISNDVFKLFFVPDWWPAADCFRWLCIAYLLYPLHALNLNILKVCGRSDLFLRLEIVKALISLSVLFFTLKQGFLMVVYGQIFVSALCYIPNVMYSNKLIKYSFRMQVIDVLPYLILSMLVGLMAHVISQTLHGAPVLVVVMVATLTSVSLYFLSVRAFNLEAWGVLNRIIVAYRSRHL